MTKGKRGEEEKGRKKGREKFQKRKRERDWKGAVS